MKHFFDMMMTVMVGFVTGVFCGKGNALQFVKVLVSGQAAGAQTWLRSGCSEGPCSVREKSISGKLLQKMTAEEMQGEPAAKENETKAEKFIRIGEYRMNKAVDAIGRLENLANRSFYKYTQEQVDAMFQALEGRVVEVKVRFMPKKAAESKTFSFGITE